MEPVINEGHLVASPHPSRNRIGWSAPVFPGMGMKGRPPRPHFTNRKALLASMVCRGPPFLHETPPPKNSGILEMGSEEIRGLKITSDSQNVSTSQEPLMKLRSHKGTREQGRYVSGYLG